MKFLIGFFILFLKIIILSLCKNKKERNNKILDLLDKKENFLFLPTPLHKLEKISSMYNNYNIYIKRDDMTGLVFGGNKSRKLEYIVHHAINNGVNVLITYGSPQSNHARQTAAVCKLKGLECYLILVRHENNKSTEVNGNLLLDHILGVNVILADSREEAEEKLETLKIKLEEEGKKYHFVAIGGSEAYGVLGYINALKEIMKQEKKMKMKFDYIIHASASLATQVGLIIGNKVLNQEYKIVGIKITKHHMDLQVENSTKMNILVDKFNKEFGTNINVSKDEFILDSRFEKEYEKMGENERNAINVFAQNEAIILDPVYTGRAAGGMLHMLENKEIPEGSNILFIHTGGSPLIFSDIYKLEKD